MTIIDDTIAEYHNERVIFSVGVYTSDGRNHCGNLVIYIEDDEGR